MYRRARTILLIVAAVLVVALIVLAVVLRPSAPQEEAATPLQGEATATQQTVISPAVTVPRPADAQMSAVDVVRQYLEYWGQKNTEGMESLLVRVDRGKTAYDEMAYEASLEVTALEERPAEEASARFDPTWYGNETPVDIALVMANYTITYNEEGKELYVRDGLVRNEYLFWLIPEDGQWRIVMQGY